MILAAGRGERLRPLTEHTPKPLLEVGGERLIERHLERLVAAGIREVVINLCHLGEQIKQFVGDGSRFGLDQLAWSYESPAPLETAGGIVQALPLLGGEPFALVNADIWTDYNFQQLPSDFSGEKLGHLVLVPNPAHHGRGDFCWNGSQLRHLDKNDYTFSGISVFSPKFFEGLEAGPRPLGPMLFSRCECLEAQIHRSTWLDIGTAERLQDARTKIGQKLA